MNFLHSKLELNSDEVVVVDLDTKANVRVLDTSNFQKYKRGDKHSYYGGLAKESPVVIKPPHAGIWHVVIDLGGCSGTVRASVRTEKG